MNDRTKFSISHLAIGLFLAVGFVWAGHPSATVMAQQGTADLQTVGSTGCVSCVRRCRYLLHEPMKASMVGQQWQPVVEQPPLAEFIDSLRGNDATIEVIIGQGRLLTTKGDIATVDHTASIAIGDPTILEFEVLPNPRMLRLLGRRPGLTDLSITTSAGETYTFEVAVVYDLDLLRAQLRQIFPDAMIKVAQLREHLIIEGQARSIVQMTKSRICWNGTWSRCSWRRDAVDASAIRRRPMLPGAPVANRPTAQAGVWLACRPRAMARRAGSRGTRRNRRPAGLRVSTSRNRKLSI